MQAFKPFFFQDELFTHIPVSSGSYWPAIKETWASLGEVRECGKAERWKGRLCSSQQSDHGSLVACGLAYCVGKKS